MLGLKTYDRSKANIFYRLFANSRQSEGLSGNQFVDDYEVHKIFQAQTPYNRPSNLSYPTSFDARDTWPNCIHEIVN